MTDLSSRVGIYILNKETDSFKRSCYFVKSVKRTKYFLTNIMHDLDLFTCEDNIVL